ncbi:MAG: thiamine diphosphokinase [Clostridia bacterium]|nr:thiamine diphosphokinase [Clostridia bacterium]
MKGVLLLNGQPYSGEIDAENAYVVCCDGAYEWARGKVRIDENVGDFDSLSYIPDPAPEKIYPSEKDFTDGEIAINRLINKGVELIEIYGGGGGREDHFLGNLHLLYLAHMHGVRAEMICEKSTLFMASGVVELKGINGKTLSVLPFGGNLHIIGSTGLKYPEPPQLSYGECRGISNVAQSDLVTITFAKGSIALIIVNREKV